MLSWRVYNHSRLSCRESRISETIPIEDEVMVPVCLCSVASLWKRMNLQETITFRSCSTLVSGSLIIVPAVSLCCQLVSPVTAKKDLLLGFAKAVRIIACSNMARHRGQKEVEGRSLGCLESVI